MVELSTNQIVMYALGAMAGAFVMTVVFRMLQDLMAVRSRCYDVAAEASKQGFDLFAKLLKGAATGSMVKVHKAIEELEELFKKPGALKHHLDELFAKQLTLRLSNSGDRELIMKAVNDWTAADQSARDKIVQEELAKRPPAPNGNGAGGGASNGGSSSPASQPASQPAAAAKP
jgi:hypothetical protein